MMEWLIEGFRYEEWANERWLDALRPFPAGHRVFEVFGHILWAQAIWLSRCKGQGNIPMPSSIPSLEELSKHLEESRSKWPEWLQQVDPCQVIEYSNTRGDEFTREAWQIAQHVLNHGTYHRGQLRQLAEDAGLDFPATDLIYSPVARGTGTL